MNPCPYTIIVTRRQIGTVATRVDYLHAENEYIARVTASALAKAGIHEVLVCSGLRMIVRHSTACEA